MFRQCMLYIFVLMAYNTSTTPLENNYGEFKLAVRNLKTCKGPKSKDCCVITPQMYNASNLFYDIQILQNVLPNKGKIVVFANSKTLVRLQMKKPCDHLFIGPLLKEIFNSEDCVFKKGNYTWNVNVEEATRSYYGGYFLYGNLTFQTILHSDHCNCVCNIAEMEFFPKNKTVPL